ncbi:MAG: hypothetical protein QOD83_1997 [Solirubrobacteraceae bacterium]|jgi:uncharacterized membrane protein YkoI|nr:hypothetical protein [Solirubrobacteraceae bacterium]
MFEKLRLHRSIAALSAATVTALGVGGIAIAQTGSATSPSTTAATQGEQPQGAERADTNEPAGSNEADERQLTGPDADRAKAAALAEVGGGKVTDVSSEKGDANEPGEATEPKETGDAADPAYQDRITYAVEITKADGSAVDVHLDDQFKVLGTEKADQGESGAGADQAGAPATAGG